MYPERAGVPRPPSAPTDGHRLPQPDDFRAVTRPDTAADFRGDNIGPMLRVFLACDDLYGSAMFFTKTLGWELKFSTPPGSGDPLGCVGLGDAEIMLGPAEDRWLPVASRDHRGAGVTVYVSLPPEYEIDAIYAQHAKAGVTTSELAERPWGERAFDAVIAGYRFLIAAPSTQ